MSVPDPTRLVVRLQWDASFARPNTWMLNGMGDGIRARALIGGYEYVQEFAVRWRTPRAEAPRTVFVRPVDDDSWLTEPMVLSPVLVKMQLQLRGAPRHASDILRCR